MKKILILLSFLILGGCFQKESKDFSSFQPLYQEAFVNLNTDEKEICKRIIESTIIENFKSYEIINWRRIMPESKSIDEPILIAAEMVLDSQPDQTIIEIYRVYPEPLVDTDSYLFYTGDYPGFFEVPEDTVIKTSHMDLDRVNSALEVFIHLIKNYNVRTPL